jgi:hypothetical protein
MKIVEFKSVENFISFLRNNIANEKIKDLIVIIDHFNGVNQGCGCKRNERVNIFKNYYENKIINIEQNCIEEIKTILQASEIVFYKYESEEVLKKF